MKNILICATLQQRFLDQVIFAKNIANETNEFKIYFYVSDDVYSLHSDIVDSLEFKVINKTNKINNNRKYNEVKNSIKEVIKNYLTPEQLNALRKYINNIKSSFLFTKSLMKQERSILDEYESNYKKILILIKQYDIKVLLINGDRHLGVEPVFLKISQVLNIPSIIPYLVYFADEEIIFDSCDPTKKIEPNIFTSQYIVNSQKNLSYKTARNTYYYPHYIGNALDKFGVLTKDPYVMGSGYSDILCLNNFYYKDLYLKYGLDERKIRVVGDGFYDHIYQQYLKKDTVKQEILKKYSFDSNKKTVVVALPQLAEHNELPWNRHWEEINFLMKNLDMLNQNILISLHPKMEKKMYNFLENKYTCKILDERLADVIPIADLFVATYSSTVIWSVLCGIKTVVVDFYEFNYSMYDFLESVIKVEKKENLKKILDSYLIKDVDFTRDWENLSRDNTFDGKTIQRYIKLISENVNDDFSLNVEK
jgi:hypothetical protein